MASILRQIVAGPRARHPEARLDLCYVTDNIIVTSGPSSVWPKKAYRNPTDQLVAFLDSKHDKDWAIFEFRAEGTGYPDSEVYDRIHHFPWPDHHPPPFAIIPNLMAAMRNWIQGGDVSTGVDSSNKDHKKRVAVVHCKAGKGRSGTAATSYLISQDGWSREEALERFTMRRMRAGFGDGVSIPSQLRWVRYVDYWANKLGKRYVERPVEVVEIHVWGLRDGVKVCVEGFVEDGRVIKDFHTFTRDEKTNVDDLSRTSTKSQNIVQDENSADRNTSQKTSSNLQSRSNPALTTLTSPVEGLSPFAQPVDDKSAINNVILRPSKPIILPTSDINIDFERRNAASSYTPGFTMVTSIAHVWFNTFFEGGHNPGQDSGVFEIEWEAMDGIKGSARKGIKCLDRLKVVWKYAAPTTEGQEIKEPEAGEPVKEGKPADWRGSVSTEIHSNSNDPDDIKDGAKHSDGVDSGRGPKAAGLVLGQMTSEASRKLLGKDLGLREDDEGSKDVSRANSVREPSHNSNSNIKSTSSNPGTSEAGEHMSTHLQVAAQEEEPSDTEGVHSHVTVKVPGKGHEVTESAMTSPISPSNSESNRDEALSAAATREEEKSKRREETQLGRQDTRAGKNLEAGMEMIANVLAKMKGTSSSSSTT